MRKAKSFIINAAILTVTSLILRTINVSFTVYISNKIGAECMGVYQLVMSIYIFAITLSTSGIGLATTRLVAEELACKSHSGVKLAVKKCICYSLCFSVVSAVLLSLSAEFITTNWLYGKISANTIYILSISLPFLSLSSVLFGYFIAVRRIIKSVSSQILDQFITISVTVYLVNLLMPKGLGYACFALIIGGVLGECLSCIYLFILFLLDKKRYCKITPPDKTITKRMLNISLPVALSSYIRSGLATYKQIMIPLGLEKSGISSGMAIAQYGMIRGMVMPVIMFPSALLSAFGSLLIPEIAEKYIQKKNDDISNIISKIFKVTLLFSICISGILFSYANELSIAIYKSPDAGVYIKIFAPLIIVMYLDDIVDAILKGLNEQVHVVVINIFDTILSICLLYTLLPIYSIKGYIIVIFASELFNSSLSIWRLIKATSFDLKIIRWVLLPIVVIIICIAITKLLVKSNLVLSIILVLTLYSIILYAVGIITKKDLVL